MRTASAPASAANLGPAFDVMALALDLRLQVSAVASSEWDVTSRGERASAQTVGMVREVAGDAGPFAVSIESEIPRARGLGSSAALRAAAALATGAADADEAFARAAAAEGHRDNVAAASYGGLVVVDADGAPHRFPIHPGLRVLVAVPDEALPTDEARAVLTGALDRDAVRRTTARVAMLVEGLRTGDAALLAGARGDEVHEAPRDAAFPLTGRLVEAALDAGALHAARSGAGSCAVAFVADAAEPVSAALAEVLGDDGRVLEPGIAAEGVRLE